jgi:hypothetical protein
LNELQEYLDCSASGVAYSSSLWWMYPRAEIGALEPYLPFSNFRIPTAREKLTRRKEKMDEDLFWSGNKSRNYTKHLAR